MVIVRPQCMREGILKIKMKFHRVTWPFLKKLTRQHDHIFNLTCKTRTPCPIKGFLYVITINNPIAKTSALQYKIEICSGVGWVLSVGCRVLDVWKTT